MKNFCTVWYHGHHHTITGILSVAILVFVAISNSYAFAASVPKTHITKRENRSHLITSYSTHGSLKKPRPNDTLGTLTFDEEFNATTLNTAIWNNEDYGPDGYQNCCLKFGSQYFTPQDISLNQGNLRITTEKRNLGGMLYTSGAITTENKISFLYGQIDIRARIPQGQGMWPALWLLTNNSDNEINIMEMANDPTIAYQTFHKNVPIYNSYVFQCISKGPDLSTDFHLYSLQWYPNSLAWFIDGILTCQLTQFVPQTPMYLLLDTAIGGLWPGPPDASTIFPEYTDVDYIRVYQADPYTSCSGLQVTTPLQISPTIGATGTTIIGTATYTNTCTLPFALNNLIIAARTPNGGNVDFENKVGVVTIQPGQSVTINAFRTLKNTDPPGQWDAFTSFQTLDGRWHPDGTNRQYFTMTG